MAPRAARRRGPRGAAAGPAPASTDVNENPAMEMYTVLTKAELSLPSYIQEDEYVEVTPESIRLRKTLLKEHERKRAKNKALA